MGKSVYLYMMTMLWVAFYLNGVHSKNTVFNQEFDAMIDRLDYSKFRSDDMLKKVKVSVCINESDDNLYDRDLSPQKHFFNKIKTKRLDKKDTQLFKGTSGNYPNDQIDKEHCLTVKNLELQRTYFREKNFKQKNLYYENKVRFRRNEIKTRISNQRRPICFNSKKEALISRKTPDKRQQHLKHETTHIKYRIRRQKTTKEFFFSPSVMFNKYSVSREETQFAKRRMNIRGSFENHVILYRLSENVSADARNTEQPNSNPSDTYRRFRQPHREITLKRRNLIFNIVPQLRSLRNLERQERPRSNGAKTKKYDTTLSWSQESRVFGKKRKPCHVPDVIKVTEKCQKKIYQRKTRGNSSVNIYESMHTRVHKRQMNHMWETRKVSIN